MNQRIDWPWFVMSQMGFGIVAGLWCRGRNACDLAAPSLRRSRRHRGARRHGRERRRGRDGDEALTLHSRCVRAILAVLLAWRCSNSPGRPGPDSEVIPPRRDTGLQHFSTRRIARHAMARRARAERRSRSAIPCSSRSPTMRPFAASRTNGVPGTPMPAFATRARGHAHRQTDRRHSCGNPLLGEARSLSGASPPALCRCRLLAIPRRGAEVYATYCSSCHGPEDAEAEGQLHCGWLVPGPGE